MMRRFTIVLIDHGQSMQDSDANFKDFTVWAVDDRDATRKAVPLAIDNNMRTCSVCER